MPLGAHFDVQKAGIRRRLADRFVKVQLVFVAFAGKLAQAAQRHLDVARAEFLGVVVVFVGALVPDLHGAAVAALVLPDADALRVLPVSAKRGGAARAYPFVATFVAFFLFFEALLERFHQLVPAHGLQFGLFFRR